VGWGAILGSRYEIRAGDTLAGIARRHFGDATLWPLLYEHNNLPQVVAQTRTRIVDPNLIFVGQVLYLPIYNEGAPSCFPSDPLPPRTADPSIPIYGPPAPGTTARPRRSMPTSPAQRGVRSIPFKYDLQQVPTIQILGPAFTATVKLSGSVTIQADSSIDFAELSRDGIEIAAKRETDLGFATLTSGAKVGFNPESGAVSFEIGLTIHANSMYAPQVSASLGASSTTGLPVYKVTITPPTAPRPSRR